MSSTVNLRNRKPDSEAGTNIVINMGPDTVDEPSVHEPAKITNDDGSFVGLGYMRLTSGILGEGKDYDVSKAVIDFAHPEYTIEKAEALLLDMMVQNTRSMDSAASMSKGAIIQMHRPTLKKLRVGKSDEQYKHELVFGKKGILERLARPLKGAYDVESVQDASGKVKRTGKVNLVARVSKEQIFKKPRQRGGVSDEPVRELRETEYLGITTPGILGPLFVEDIEGHAVFGTRFVNELAAPKDESGYPRYDQLDISLETWADVGAQLADRVEHLHRRQSIHRDIKPGNVLLEELVNKQGEKEVFVNLADLSIMKLGGLDAVGRTQTDDSYSIGTPSFMAPEQLWGDATSQSDIAGIGGTLLDYLTGQAPNPGNFNAIANRTYRPQDPRKIIKTKTKSQRKALYNLTLVLAGTLSGRNPEAMVDGAFPMRYHTVTQLKEDLQAISRGQEPAHIKGIVKEYSKAENEEQYISNVFSPELPEPYLSRQRTVLLPVPEGETEEVQRRPSFLRNLAAGTAIAGALFAGGAGAIMYAKDMTAQQLYHHAKEKVQAIFAGK